MKKQSKLFIASTVLLASAIFVVLSSENTFSAAIVDPGHSDDCSENDSMVSYLKTTNACYTSGIGWLYYDFSHAFIEGILINKGTGEVYKNGDVPYTAVTNPEYDQNTYRVLKTSDLLMGPGNSGNGDWLDLSKVSQADQDIDSCRQGDGSGIYREGYFEAKTKTFKFGDITNTAKTHTAIRDRISVGPSAQSGATTVYKVGITGKVNFYNQSNGIRSYRNANFDQPRPGGTLTGKGVMEYINEHSNLAVGQVIYYDGFEVMSTNTGYNIEGKPVLKDYIEYAITYFKGGVAPTQDEKDKVYDALTHNADGTQTSGHGNDTVKIITNKNLLDINASKYGFAGSDDADRHLRQAASDVFEHFNVDVNAFCFVSKSDTTYTADTIIGTNSNKNEFHTNENRYSENNKKKVLNGDPSSYDVIAGYYDNISMTGKTNQTLEYGIRLYDADNGQPITDHGEVHRTIQFRSASSSLPNITTSVVFGDYKNIQVCSYVKYYATFTLSTDSFSEPQEKESCIILSKEVHSSILWSKSSAFAKVGGIQRSNTTTDCGALVMQGNPRGNRATSTVTSEGYSLSAAEAPNAQGGRYDWSPASATGECHVWSQSGTLPSRIIIQTGIQRKAGVHVGDGPDVLEGSNFDINLSGKTYNATTYHYRNFLEQDFSGPLASQLILNAGNTTQFVSVKNATTDVDSEFLFPEQTFSASSAYTHPKIAKDSGSSNDASYKLEGASDVLTSSSSVNFSIVRDGFRCPDRFKYDSAYYYGVYNGRNIASIDYVISDGINNTEYKTGAGGNAYVKPGQGVQFVYNMCAGGTYTHMARTSADTLYGLWTDSSNTHFILSVSDETSDGEDHAAGYLFGKTPFGYNNQSTSATFSTSGNSSNISSSVNFLQIGTNADAQQRDTGVKFNASFTQYSLRTPYGVNREAAGKYSCNYGDVSDPYYYIIGDGLGGICSKDNSDNYARRKAGWDLGRRFKESITYTNLVYEGGNKVQGPNDVTTSATINTPFNYKTNPTAEIGNIDNSFITAGDSLNVTANFNLDPITNNALSFYNNSAEKTYNTRSKSSLIVSYGFIVSADKKRDFEANYSDLKYVDNPDTGMTLAALCDATFPNNEYCRTTLNKDASYDNKDTLSLGDNNAVDKTKTYILSSDGSDKTEDNVGRAYGWSFNNRVYTIPDEYNDEGQIGDIVCVVSAIYPANSYNLNKDESSISEDDPRMLNGLNGENAGSGAKWAISKPSCTTVSKKPTFSVEGGSLFASGSIDTYTGTYRSKAGNARFDTYMYGSWSEYGIMLGKKNNGMASGAGYGYGSIGGWKIHKPNDHGETYHPVKLSNNECLLATQTVSNTKCGSPDNSYGDGASSEVIKKIQGQLANVMSDLRARYKTNTLENSAGETATPLHNGAIISGNDICTYNPDKDEYRTSDGVTGFCSSKGEQYYTIASSVFEINDDIEFVFNDRNDENASKRNRTIVIRTNGTLKINGNIKIQNDGYSSIKQIPNVLIFAKDIQVSDKVSQIDAWIIAEGTFNTCAYKSSDPSVKYNDESDLHANDCNKSLLINGPVSANKIKLFRTAGAGTTEEDPLKISSYNYVIRAEIFNMTPATYLWARAQAESNSGLITTYVKELPVRY